jgi:hypothetical protein
MHMFAGTSILVSMALTPLPVTAQWQDDVSPELAASHLLKKADALYPEFVKAARIEGVVRVHVSIGTDGHIGSIGVGSGPPSLAQAAEDAVSQYVYRPLEKDGHPVVFNTTVDVGFKLGNGQGARQYTAPPITLARFDWFNKAHRVRVSSLSVDLRKWLKSDIEKRLAWRADKSEVEDAKREYLAAATVVPVPVKQPGAHVYLITLPTRDTCGTGGCWTDFVEEHGNRVRLIGKLTATGFYLHPRPASSFPDVFFATSMGAFRTEIQGYSNVNGIWGLLYCGEIVHDEQREKGRVEQCDDASKTQWR